MLTPDDLLRLRRLQASTLRLQQDLVDCAALVPLDDDTRELLGKVAVGCVAIREQVAPLVSAEVAEA